MNHSNIKLNKVAFLIVRERKKAFFSESFREEVIAENGKLSLLWKE